MKVIKDTKWDSELKIVEPEILIKRNVIDILWSIEKKVDTEFAVLFKGKWEKDGFVVSDEYYIPKQKVSYASVDFEEDISKKRAEGYNVIIHKHPSKFGFSGADEDSINAHFLVSMIYYKGEIVDANMSVQVNGDVKIRIKPKISIIPNEVIDINISNIEKEKEPEISVWHKPYEDFYGYYGLYGYVYEERKKKKEDKR
jgi:hypothetical protein